MLAFSSKYCCTAVQPHRAASMNSDSLFFHFCTLFACWCIRASLQHGKRQNIESLFTHTHFCSISRVQSFLESLDFLLTQLHHEHFLRQCSQCQQWHTVMAFASLMTVSLNWYKEIIYLRIWELKRQARLTFCASLKTHITCICLKYLLTLNMSA